jgi:ribosome-binding protein aMBF1 (putative translation factor)
MATKSPKRKRSSVPRGVVPGFAKLVKKARTDKEWSLHDLAKVSGVGATTICNIEREWRSPSLRVAMQLAKALGLETQLASPAGDPQGSDLHRVKRGEPQKV